MLEVFTSFTKKTIFLVLITSFLTILLVSALIYFKPRLASGLLEFLSPTPRPIPISLKGVAVIGDSQSDEYRTDDNRGVTYASTTLNWVEHLAKYRSISFGEIGAYSEPRRNGYEYNWARTGATTLSMLESGQHIGVAEQIASKKVNVVIIYIGANDFAPYITDDGYEAIYEGRLTQAKIYQKINSTYGNIKTAVDTLKGAGDVRIILVTIPDWGRNPAVRIAFPLPQQRARVTEVIDEINSELKRMANEEGLVILDINSFYEDLQNQRDDKQIALGDVVLENALPSDNPRHLFLDDGVHPGSAINALFANKVIQTLNTFLLQPISEFSNQEMLQNSGL